jgi:hypothetical protein
LVIVGAEFEGAGVGAGVTDDSPPPPPPPPPQEVMKATDVTSNNNFHSLTIYMSNTLNC